MAKKLGKLEPLACHGFEGSVNGDEAVGDCPFCGKANHFYANVVTGQWSCKRCGEEGNVLTFLTKLSQQVHEETAEADWKRLEKLRGIPIKTLKAWGLGFNGHEWLLPVYSDRGTVKDIRRWNFKHVQSTAGCKLQLYGGEQLLKEKPSTDRRAWLCEGEWDGLAMDWWLSAAGRPQDIVVAVPGASVFKQEWQDWFSGWHVMACYDNDTAGDGGAKKASEMLDSVAETVEYVWWPEGRPEGYDVRDFVSEFRKNREDPKKALQVFMQLFHPHHRRDPSAVEVKEKPDPSKAIKFEQLIKVFSKYKKINKDLSDAMRVSLAIVVGKDLKPDPLWLYLVGPPGGGKTMVLNAFKGVDTVSFHSSLTPKCLVSGWKEGRDPSLLPTFKGKTAIFKDGTELLSIHPNSKGEVYGTLRGAYDGDVNREFGNGVKRKYTDLFFNMIIGVTPMVHADNQASMGERFMKFELGPLVDEGDDEVSHIVAAINGLEDDMKASEEMEDAVRRFCFRNCTMETLPRISQDYVVRIAAMAQMVGMLRTKVEREQYGIDKDPKFRPRHEVGTRLGKQLTKLCRLLAFVVGRKEVTEEDYAITERVAFDSAVAFHLDVVAGIMAHGGEATLDDIRKKIMLPKTTVGRKIKDLRLMGLCRQNLGTMEWKKGGQKPMMVRLSGRLLQLCKQAKFNGQFTSEHIRRIRSEHLAREDGYEEDERPEDEEEDEVQTHGKG